MTGFRSRGRPTTARAVGVRDGNLRVEEGDGVAGGGAVGRAG